MKEDKNVKGPLFWVLLASVVLALCGCGMTDEVVIDKITMLADGTGTGYKLDPGRYKVEVTASNDGVTVAFVGCSCPGTEHQTQTFSTICELTQTGQVVIDNPSILGTGAGSTVTVKITKLSR